MGSTLASQLSTRCVKRQQSSLPGRSGKVIKGRGNEAALSSDPDRLSAKKSAVETVKMMKTKGTIHYFRRSEGRQP